LFSLPPPPPPNPPGARMGFEKYQKPMRERVRRLQGDLMTAYGRDGVFIAALEGCADEGKDQMPVTKLQQRRFNHATLRQWTVVVNAFACDSRRGASGGRCANTSRPSSMWRKRFCHEPRNLRALPGMVAQWG